MTQTVESQTGSLFGELWTRLSDEQYRQSVELFTLRAEKNGFDLDWLKGKRCLDGGCGSGRYSVAMALHGAASIDAIDVSQTGIAEASRRAADFKNIHFRQASVLDIPFEDATFDFVWSAGVIHHTRDFDGALSELTRVLKPGGKLFLLVYGAGGLRWKVIRALRLIAMDLGHAYIDRAIQGAGLPANNRKHFMDDLFVPIQLLTDWPTLRAKLEGEGYKEITRWTDHSHDHERDEASQREDMVKLIRIFEAAVANAANAFERQLSDLGLRVAKEFVDQLDRIMADADADAQTKRDLVVGEGVHRVIAVK